MKRFLLLIVIAIFAVTGCGAKTDKDEESAEDKTAVVEEEETSEEKEKEEATEAEEDSEGLELKMPPDYFEGFTEEEIISIFNEMGVADITVGDDGFFIVKMTKEEQTAILTDMKADIDSDVDEIIGTMGVEAIENAQMNDEVTELIVTINQDVYDGDMGGLVLLDFSIHAMPYQLLNGVTEEEFDFEVVLIDSETGEEIERTSVHDE